LFTAVWDTNKARAKAFAEQYGVKVCSNIEGMGSGAGVEAVMICVPHPLHAETANKAIQAGMHVLVEKPLAPSLENCDAMIELAKKKELPLVPYVNEGFTHPL